MDNELMRLGDREHIITPWHLVHLLHATVAASLFTNIYSLIYALCVFAWPLLEEDIAILQGRNGILDLPDILAMRLPAVVVGFVLGKIIAGYSLIVCVPVLVLFYLVGAFVAQYRVENPRYSASVASAAIVEALLLTELLPVSWFWAYTTAILLGVLASPLQSRRRQRRCERCLARCIRCTYNR
jgi:hypothetical protein